MDLKEYLYQTRKTQTQGCAELGITKQYMSLLYTKQSRPSLSLAKQIIKWSNGAIAPYDIYPDLFEVYKETIGIEK